MTMIDKIVRIGIEPAGTPRTDALLGEIWSSPPQPNYYVPPKMIDLARQLERENNELRRQIDALRK